MQRQSGAQIQPLLPETAQEKYYFLSQATQIFLDLSDTCVKNLVGFLEDST